MTAVNVILRPHTAYLVTDGETQERGFQVQPRGKVILFPHLRAALALRGYPPVLGSLLSIIGHRRASFDEAAEGLGEDLRAAWEPLVSALPVSGPQEAILVGFPEEAGSRPRCATTASHDGWGREPYSVAMCSAVLGPNDGSLAERLGRDFTDPAVPFVANADAIAIIDAQRQMPGSGVGGFVQLTTILRDSITTKVLHRWAD